MPRRADCEDYTKLRYADLYNLHKNGCSGELYGGGDMNGSQTIYRNGPSEGKVSQWMNEEAYEAISRKIQPKIFCKNLQICHSRPKRLDNNRL